jgi:hypothetical protein
MDREYDPVEETICQTAVFILDAQAGLDQEFFLVASRPGGIRESLAAYRSPSQPILAYGLILQTAAFEILVSYGLSFGGLKAFLEELARIFRDEKKALVTLP